MRPPPQAERCEEGLGGLPGASVQDRTVRATCHACEVLSTASPGKKGQENGARYPLYRAVKGERSRTSQGPFVVLMRM